MQDETFQVIREVLEEICEIDGADISPDSNLIVDLEIDSLDFLDLTYEIDHRFQIKLPMDEWTGSAEPLTEEQVNEYFRIRNIGDYIEHLVEQKRKGEASP